MNTPDDRSPDVSRDATTVSFGDAFAQSPQFDSVFGEGMALVERVANYLDGAGRKQSRRLSTPVSSAYATESMRMTTRLLELASWLLIHRALKNGEISAEEAERRRRKVKLRPSGRPSHVKHFDELPEDLQAMIVESFALSDRIMRIDRAMHSDEMVAPVTTNPVGAQMSTLRAAFKVIDGGRS